VPRGVDGTEGSGELLRLPPGRHGLSREFVTSNQRERLAAGMIAAVAEHGFRATTITQISAAAGVSRRTFYSYFGSKEECFFDTYGLVEKHLVEALEEAAAAQETWTGKVRARIEEMLAFFAANPDLVRFSIIAPAAAGGEVAARYRAFFERLTATIVSGVPDEAGYSKPSEGAEKVLAGALTSRLVSMVDAGEGERLPMLATELLQLTLVPIIGRERALAI
jgi:AcrR family transcriptional regulator